MTVILLPEVDPNGPVTADVDEHEDYLVVLTCDSRCGDARLISTIELEIDDAERLQKTLGNAISQVRRRYPRNEEPVGTT